VESSPSCDPGLEGEGCPRRLNGREQGYSQGCGHVHVYASLKWRTFLLLLVALDGSSISRAPATSTTEFRLKFQPEITQAGVNVAATDFPTPDPHVSFSASSRRHKFGQSTETSTVNFPQSHPENHLGMEYSAAIRFWQSLFSEQLTVIRS